MDIVGQLQRETQTQEVRAHRAARRSRRLDRLGTLRSALSDVGLARSASFQWFIRDPKSANPAENGILIAHGQHPGTAALSAAHTILSSFDIPAGYDLRFRGMSRTSGRGAHGMTDGVV